MQNGQLHRRHHRRSQSTLWLERRPLPGAGLEPARPQSPSPTPGRQRYRVVRINGEWVVQFRQESSD